jgi:hypothetical protein
MARSRKPRKPAAEAPEEITEETPKQKPFFTVMLKTALSYEVDGMVFRRGIPKQVALKHLPKFKANGHFQVSGL